LRTAVIILGGILFFGLCLAGRRWLGGASPEAVTDTLKIFIPLWLGVAVLNMYIGVKRAGYSVAEEFPIFLAIFALPAAVALVVWWRATR